MSSSGNGNGKKDGIQALHQEKEIPTPQCVVDQLLLLITQSSDRNDREWARGELVKAMKIAYSRWYPDHQEFRIANGSFPVMVDQRTGRTEIAKRIKIPDVQDIARWLMNTDGKRSSSMKYTTKALNWELTRGGNAVLELWHLANAMKDHIIGLR
jgi:hypothetical protein